MIDVYDGGIFENIGIFVRKFSDEMELSAVAHENCIELSTCNPIGYLRVGIEKMKKRGDGKFIDHFHVFSNLLKVEIECHTGSVGISVNAPMSHDEEMLSIPDEFLDFSYFLLLFLHFYVF